MSLNPSVNAVLPVQGKSFAYDENYPDPQISVLSIGVIASSTGTVSNALAECAISGGVSGKQIRSITVTPLVAPTSADYLSLSIHGYTAQAYGTATTTVVTVGNGSNLGTSINLVQVTTITWLQGTVTASNGGASGTQLIGLGTQVAYNPTFIPFVASTATITAGGTVQAGYVFPAGPNGGLTLGPNDVLVLAKGTDSAAVYMVEIEYTFTPGGAFSR